MKNTIYTSKQLSEEINTGDVSGAEWNGYNAAKYMSMINHQDDQVVFVGNAEQAAVDFQKVNFGGRVQTHQSGEVIVSRVVVETEMENLVRVFIQS